MYNCKKDTFLQKRMLWFYHGEIVFLFTIDRGITEAEKFRTAPLSDGYPVRLPGGLEFESR
jgi:hypothetical protein